MEKHSRRRLRSASVQLGTLTLLALTLTACNSGGDDDDDDDDCAMGPIGGTSRVVAAALAVPGTVDTLPASVLAALPAGILAGLPAGTMISPAAGVPAALGGAAPQSGDPFGEPTGAVPERGGFGTHLASCGG